MHTLSLCLGGRVFSGLIVPENCSVGLWRELVVLGMLGAPLPEAVHLACRAEPPEEGGQRLDETARLPTPPRPMYLTGPHIVLQALEQILLDAVHAAATAAAAATMAATESLAADIGGPDAGDPEEPRRRRRRGAAAAAAVPAREPGQRRRRGDAAGPAVAADPALSQDAGGRRSTVMLRRALTGEELATVQLGPEDGVAELLQAVASKVGGSEIAVRLMHGQRRLFCHEKQAELQLAAEDFVEVICQAYRVVTGSNDGTAKVWSKGECLHTLRGHSRSVLAVAALPESDIVATGGADCTARLWDAQSGECLQTFEADEGVNSVDFSPNGLLLLGGCADGKVVCWSRDSGACAFVLLGHSGGVFSVAWSPDGQLIATASADHTAKIWHSGFGECMETLKGHRAIVRRAAFSRGGCRVVTCSWDHTAKVWDVASGSCLESFRHAGDVLSATFCPEGDSRVLTACADRSARVWRAEGGVLLCLTATAARCTRRSTPRMAAASSRPRPMAQRGSGTPRRGSAAWSSRATPRR